MNTPENLQPWTWARMKNPHPGKYPGVWIGWRTNEREYGEGHLSVLHAYIGPKNVCHIAKMLIAGKRKGPLTAA